MDGSLRSFKNDYYRWDTGVSIYYYINHNTTQHNNLPELVVPRPVSERLLVLVLVLVLVVAVLVMSSQD